MLSVDPRGSAKIVLDMLSNRFLCMERRRILVDGLFRVGRVGSPRPKDSSGRVSWGPVQAGCIGQLAILDWTEGVIDRIKLPSRPKCPQGCVCVLCGERSFGTSRTTQLRLGNSAQLYS